MSDKDVYHGTRPSGNIPMQSITPEPVAATGLYQCMGLERKVGSAQP